jgi:hypothetical protein
VEFVVSWTDPVTRPTGCAVAEAAAQSAAAKQDERLLAPNPTKRPKSSVARSREPRRVAAHFGLPTQEYCQAIEAIL